MDHADDAFRRARLLAELGRHGEAERQLRRALATAPEDPDLLTFLAYLLRVQRRYLDALDAAEAAVAADPESVEAHLERAEASIGLWRGPQAVEAATEAVRLRPWSAEPHAVLAAALAADDAPNRAREAARTAVCLEPRSVTALLTLADVELDAGDRTAAAEAVRAALQLDPTNTRGRWLLGLVERENLQIRRSMRTLRDVVRDDPAQARVAGMLWPLRRVTSVAARMLTGGTVLAAGGAFLADRWDAGPAAVAARGLAGIAVAATVGAGVRVALPAGRTPWRALRLVPPALRRSLVARLCATGAVAVLLAGHAATGDGVLAGAALALVPALWLGGLAVLVTARADDPGFHQALRDAYGQLRELRADLRTWAADTRRELRDAWRGTPPDPPEEAPGPNRTP